MYAGKYSEPLSVKHFVRTIIRSQSHYFVNWAIIIGIPAQSHQEYRILGYNVQTILYVTDYLNFIVLEYSG